MNSSTGDKYSDTRRSDLCSEGKDAWEDSGFVNLFLIEPCLMDIKVEREENDINKNVISGLVWGDWFIVTAALP